jgi:TRAP-type C4-dicarboxylate transport system permease small subunit
VTETNAAIEPGGRNPSGRKPRLERLTGLVAILGGALALGVAMLVVTSVLGRWLFNAPIDGDFEMVKMATAMAVFAYLPYTQARRGNIMVDSFTAGLPRWVQAAIDAFWDLVFAGFMALCTYALWFGTTDALRSGEVTMQRQIILWPSIALCMVLAGLVAVTAVLTALERIRLARHDEQHP